MFTKNHLVKIVPMSPKLGKHCSWQLSWGFSPQLSPPQQTPLSTISKGVRASLGQEHSNMPPWLDANQVSRRDLDTSGRDAACLPRKPRNEQNHSRDPGVVRCRMLTGKPSCPGTLESRESHRRSLGLPPPSDSSASWISDCFHCSS